MKRKVVKLRPSPNEEARIIREEHERRRKLRIQQVREQQRYVSLQICREVQQRRQRELEQLAEELRQDWEQQQREKLHTLQRLYQESLQLLGQGHRSAKLNEPDLATIAQREEENHAKAEERYREALKELKSQRLKDHEMQSRTINARKKALQVEKERSAKVASLPPPAPDPTQYVNSKKPHVVKKSDVSAFAATHYHMHVSTVDREVDTQQPSAHEGAELEARRLQDLEREEKRRREEQLEKARLRGNQALRKERLVQDCEHLLVELEHMQQTDFLRRRQQVSQMPPQIFQPLYKRQEMREDFQREMEFAFEDMYTGERRVKGDLVVQLVPEPLPALSTSSQDQELDVTLGEITTTETENTQPDTEQKAGSTEQETSTQVRPSRPAPRRALKKLLDRIRSQRNQLADHSSHVPAADSLTAVSDQIPEQDTSIDTGSLTSEMKDTLLPVELIQPAHSPAALETTEHRADTLFPDALANRIQEFEEERKKREEELEREKQQQVALLQELEEQKAKLEQMLLEAQQEREDLKAAVAQEVPVNQPEAPVRDQEVISVTPGPATDVIPPAGEDSHTRRIREYQQRLLEQNRVHQRSVEVARQRLDEYQRALRIRYSMTSTSLPSTLTPSGLSLPPVNPPAPLQRPMTAAVPAYLHNEPQTSVEVPSRESVMLVSPLHPPPSSGSAGPKLLLGDVKSSLSSNQRPDVNAWLTDNIMERVTAHLPETVRPSSVTTEPLPNKGFTTHHPTRFPVQPASEPVQAIIPSTTDAAPLVPGLAAIKSGTLQRGSLQMGSLSSSEDEFVNQRRELQEVQRRVLEQRKTVELQQSQQEEQRRRQEVEMEQMRRQKEMLQALIPTDPQPVPVAAGEVPVSDISQARLKLLASLLRAIEESNGGTLSHLQDHQEEDDAPQQLLPSSIEKDPISQSRVLGRPVPASVHPGLLPPPRAAKPPVTRIRLGMTEMMPEQHELSAIQEVETPADTSQVTGLEDSVAVPTHIAARDPQEKSRSSLQTPPVSSRGRQIAERPTGTSSRSSGLVWRERLLMGAGTSPESSDCDSALRVISPLSSDFGRVAVTSDRSPTESPHRPTGPESLSSTTISTGSYTTTEPEQNADKYLPITHCEQQERDTEFFDVYSPSGLSSCTKEHSAAGRAVGSLFNDTSIQCIIDKYTRKLNISLSTAGRTSVSEGSYMEEPNSSVAQQSLDQASESRRDHESSSGCSPLPSDAADTQSRDLQWDNRVCPVMEDVPGEDPEQDSFRPLIGQLADESSCLAADQREPPMERLFGHPSAHSSIIGQLPGPPVSESLEEGGWDSTLSRMIGRLSHQSSSHWLSGGQDFYAGQLMGQMALEQSTTWLEEDQEENQMRPLVGEMDDDHSSGERNHVDVSAEARLPSHPTLPPDTSIPQEQNHIRLDLGPDRTEGLDSFHPLLAEVTHNETADPSMTFHQVPNSPEPVRGEHSISTASQDSEIHTDLSVGSDPSLERLRTEQCSFTTAFHESFCHVITTRMDVDLTALSLSNLTMCDITPALDMPEGGEADRTCMSERPELPALFCAEQLKSEQGPNLRNAVPVSNITDVAGEKGILEQSEITLVSLTNTTLQEQDRSITEQEGMWEDKPPGEVREEAQRGQQTQGSESTLVPEETPEDKNQIHPVRFLEFQWGPSKVQEAYQQKRTALVQRSSCRVEELKAKVALAKVQPEVQAPSEAREQCKAKDSQLLSCRTKTESGPQHKANESKGGSAEQNQTTETSGLIQQMKSQLPPPGTDSGLKTVGEVKICTLEQRKRDVSGMHQRTKRLYEQLEEVKQQKAIRSRQEAYAKNRLKAKEFHKKTLQKLRARQTKQ
ncbi:centrosomal protein of 295 kDa isoform X1 [Mastacembelus armatus]|nr:centrosomal protein of 295 kDa isoform X1 [Mastacembelus armatus]